MHPCGKREDPPSLHSYGVIGIVFGKEKEYKKREILIYVCSTKHLNT